MDPLKITNLVLIIFYYLKRRRKNGLPLSQKQSKPKREICMILHCVFLAPHVLSSKINSKMHIFYFKLLVV